MKIVARLVTLATFVVLLFLGGSSGCFLDSSGYGGGTATSTSSGGKGGETSASTGGGGMGGSTISASSGGSGGDTTTSSSGGNGGGTTSTSSGGGGMGGSGGTGGGSPTCDPGDAGTPTDVTATGTTQTSAYLHDALGDEQYSASTPASLTLSGQKLPAQLVLSGQNGLDLSFSGGDPVEIWSVNLIQDPLCDSSGEYFSQACEALVARWFRCIRHPAEELDCADAQDIFASQGFHSTFSQSGGAAAFKVVADIRCATP